MLRGSRCRRLRHRSRLNQKKTPAKTKPRRGCLSLSVNAARTSALMLRLIPSALRPGRAKGGRAMVNGPRNKGWTETSHLASKIVDQSLRIFVKFNNNAWAAPDAKPSWYSFVMVRWCSGGRANSSANLSDNSTTDELLKIRRNISFFRLERFFSPKGEISHRWGISFELLECVPRVCARLIGVLSTS